MDWATRMERSRLFARTCAQLLKFNLVWNFSRQILAGFRLMHQICCAYVLPVNAKHKILIILFMVWLKSPNRQLIQAHTYFEYIHTYTELNIQSVLKVYTRI